MDRRDHDVADVGRTAEPEHHPVGDLPREPKHVRRQGGDVDRQVGPRLVTHERELGREALAVRRLGSPRRIARTAATYSRIWVTGRSIFAPYQFSTVTLCETPSPSTIRPPENSSIVAAVCAIVAGVREKIGTTPVPSLIRSLAAA